MLIWDTNPRSLQSFSPIGQRTAEKFQFLSVTDYNNRQTQELQKANKTIVQKPKIPGGGEAGVAMS
jgi:hypothetical protein